MDERPAHVSRRHLLEASAFVAVGAAGSALVGAPAATADVRTERRSPAETIDGRVAGIVRLGADVIAVGHDRSGRGVAWRRGASGRWDIVAAFADAEPTAVTAYAGGMLAVGARAGSAAAWLSADGVSWRSVLLDATGALSGVAAAGGTVLAVGQHADGETTEGAGALVIRSTDGQRWERVVVQGLPDDEVSGLTTITWYAGRWVAASHAVAGCALWQSDDGVRWQPAAAPAEAGVVITGLTAVGAQLAAVGSTIADTQPCLWIRRAGRWHAVPTVRRHGAAENGVLQHAVPLGTDALLLVGTRGDRSVTVVADKL